MHSNLGRTIMFGIVCLVAAAAGPASAQRDDKSESNLRPKFSLRAQPNVGVSPARIVLTAELTGGANDYEEYYCPTVLWEWGDGTESESTIDCEPYEAGKSEIRRRFVQEHVFRNAGSNKVWVRLKRNDKLLASATVNVHIQPGRANDFDR
jgi:hypothetical protein